MRLVRSLQHWLSGTGPRLPVTDLVPEGHPIRQWADTFPWATLVSAIEQSCATRFPKKSPRGRRPMPLRVLCALELLKHARGASDEAIGHRLRTDCAVMEACGLRDSQGHPSQAHFGLPETLCACRGRRDEALREERMASQAAAAMDAGLVSPAPLVLDTLPCEQGSQRVTDATTRSQAQKKREHSWSTSLKRAAAGRPHASSKPQAANKRAKKSCGALAAAAGAKRLSWSSWCATPHRNSWNVASPAQLLPNRPRNVLNRPRRCVSLNARVLPVSCARR